MIFYSYYDSPVGQLLLVGDGENVHRIEFPTTSRPVTQLASWKSNSAVFRTLTDQLDAYFDGSLKEFTVRVAADGSDFQRRVWDELQTIEYGQTRTYADIARSIGKPTACRAVGSANGRNPVSIIIPCHRVIGTNGKLTGYAGGISTKQWLLSHEAGEQSLFGAAFHFRGHPFQPWFFFVSTAPKPFSSLVIVKIQAVGITL